MSPSLAVVIAVLIAAMGMAYVINRLIALRAGLLKETTETAASEPVDTSDLGLSDTGPTVVHFSAVWCGPCAGVRRVVHQVCGDLPEVAHVEIDMDANPVRSPATFGAVAADDVHLRRRRPPAVPSDRRPHRR